MKNELNTIVCCPICGNCDAETVFKLNYKYIIDLTDDYELCIKHCKKCGFLYNGNSFSLEMLESRYKNFSKYEYESKKNKVQIESTASYRNRCIYQKNILDLVSGGTYNSVFEVGAASGYNLNYYKLNGKSVSGIEPSKENCDIAKEIFDINIDPLTIEQINTDMIPNQDVIILSHTLEHLLHPNETIKKLSKINNGYFLIEVPCFDMKFDDEPYGMFGEEHINYFTFESLQYLMNQNGYTCISSQLNMLQENVKYFPAGYPSILAIFKKEKTVKTFKVSNDTIQTLSQYLNNSKAKFETIKKIIDGISPNEKVALWGVGHVFSIVSANTNIFQKNIISIIDNDYKKNGKEINGIIIESFDKYQIEKKGVDTIVILSYVAQDVIKKIIEESNIKCKVKTLY